MSRSHVVQRLVARPTVGKFGSLDRADRRQRRVLDITAMLLPWDPAADLPYLLKVILG